MGMINKKRLYSLFIICLIAGYIWFYYCLSSQPTTNGGKEIHFCLIKSITGIPCPSCGSTRSVIEISHGNLLNALYYNPLGYIIFVIMLVLPFWIIYDLILGRSSLYVFYKKSEEFISRKAIAIILISLILANWFWNIHKGL